MATREDYQATAGILHERVKDSLVRIDGVAIPDLMKPGHSHGLIYDLVRLMANQFADNYAKDNPNFKRDLFMQAIFH